VIEKELGKEAEVLTIYALVRRVDLEYRYVLISLSLAVDFITRRVEELELRSEVSAMLSGS